MENNQPDGGYDVRRVGMNGADNGSALHYDETDAGGLSFDDATLRAVKLYKKWPSSRFEVVPLGQKFKPKSHVGAGAVSKEATKIPSLRSLYRSEDDGHVDDPTTAADDREV